MADIWSLMHIRHENIVQFMGSSFHPDSGSLSIVTNPVKAESLHTNLMNSEASRGLQTPPANDVIAKVKLQSCPIQTDTYISQWKWTIFFNWWWCPGFIFGHFFGGSFATPPHLDSVTDDHWYSQLLVKFPSVGVGIVFNGSFSRKKCILISWEGFLRGWGCPPKKPKRPFSSKPYL